DSARQRPDEYLGRQGITASPLLHTLRGLPQCMPGLSTVRGLGVWLGLSRSDWGGDNAASRAAGVVRRIALPVVFVLRMPGSLPGKDRHPASAATPAP